MNLNLLPKLLDCKQLWSRGNNRIKIESLSLMAETDIDVGAVVVACSSCCCWWYCSSCAVVAVAVLLLHLLLLFNKTGQNAVDNVKLNIFRIF